MSSDEPRFWNEFLDRLPVCGEVSRRHSEIAQQVTAFIAGKNPLLDYPVYGYVNPVTGAHETSVYVKEWKAFPYTRFEDEYIDLNIDTVKFDIDGYVKWVRRECPVLPAIFDPWERDGWI